MCWWVIQRAAPTRGLQDNNNNMSTREEPANLGKVLSFLREWDRGDRTVRGRMLNTFLSQHKGKSFCELECEFAQVSSLFLARLTTWMRLTYPSSPEACLRLRTHLASAAQTTVGNIWTTVIMMISSIQIMIIYRQISFMPFLMYIVCIHYWTLYTFVLWAVKIIISKWSNGREKLSIGVKAKLKF